MSKIILILLLTFSGCMHGIIVERCTLSFQFNKCICYDYNYWAAKRISEPRLNEIEYCEDLTGFAKETWAETLTPNHNYLCKKDKLKKACVVKPTPTPAD